jgi:hypothetical protein
MTDRPTTSRLDSKAFAPKRSVQRQGRRQGARQLVVADIQHSEAHRSTTRGQSARPQCRCSTLESTAYCRNDSFEKKAGTVLFS